MKCQERKIKFLSLCKMIRLFLRLQMNYGTLIMALLGYVVAPKALIREYPANMPGAWKTEIVSVGKRKKRGKKKV